MNSMHDSNRRYWDKAAEGWEHLRDEDGLWQRCPNEPEFGFAGSALRLIREVVDLPDKDVCVVGSGDNYAAFALAGMGANVTSIDFSAQQLEVASKRAKRLGLAIAFVQADAADLRLVGDAQFDLVCSTNGFFTWIAAVHAVFNEIFRILRPGGYYICYDIHPFQRPWKDQIRPIEVEKPYWQTGPFPDAKDGTFNFRWTLADILNPLVSAGFILRRILESSAEDSRFWQGFSYLPGTDESLQNWHENPRSALPFWLTMALQRPAQHD